MSATHKTIRTPNPAERSLLILVPEDSFVDAAGVLPAEGTLYSDDDWKTFFDKAYNKNFSGFRYVGQGEDVSGGGSLIFVKSKTDAQRNTPFRTITECKGHHWHPILKALEIIPDESTPRSYLTANGQSVGQNTLTGPSFYVRQDYKPSVDEGSRFVIEEFFSDIPYEIPQYPTPQPSSVSYDVPGASGGFPECLHGDIAIPEMATATGLQTVGADGVSITRAIGSGALQGQFFPRTNFTDWAPYVLSDTQEFRNGYYRVRVTVFPPPQPKLSIR